MSLVVNKKVHLEYELLERFEAGMELLGYEVKSIRAGHGSLAGSRVLVRGGEAYLVGASIPAWQPVNAPKDYDKEHSRRLLLSKRQIANLAAAEGEKGLTVVPVSMYNKGRNLKLEIAIARGKKKHDKRQTLRERDEKRDIARSLKTK
jgi:SsrA-binding protein